MGNIPPEIGNFSTLIRLWLHDNQLSGNIPPEIGNILSLDGLVLRNNQLTGNIPPEIGNLANLHSLVLSNNQLTGSLPKTLGNLLLNNFHVFNNQLSGCYHSDLTPLCDAWISILDDPDNADVSDGNNFDVPWEDFCDSGSGICVVSCTDGDYTALRALYLSTDGDNWTNNSGWPSADYFTANVLMPTGTDASTWYGVTTDAGGCVTALNLSNNMLIGSVPAEIEELNDLTSLNLSDNALSGGIPAEIGNLSNLTQLDLSSNTLNGIPTEIGNLSNLTVLNLANNTFIGGIPTEIGNLINLTNLNLANSTLTGYIPSVLGNLTNLTDLNLSYNQLLDCYHPNLVSLCTQLNNSTNAYISDGNNFDATWEDFCNTGAGTCLSCYESEYIALRALYLSTDGDNWIDRENWPDATFFNSNPNLPSGVDMSDWYGVYYYFGDSCIGRVSLGANGLRGTIPPEIEYLRNTIDLSLSNNHLTDPIPPEIGNMFNLEELRLYSNDFKAPIIPEIGNLINLKELNLQHNRFSGTIPPQLGNLSALEELYLGNNHLESPIPAEIGNLATLETLFLSDNKFTGKIQPALGNLSNLSFLTMSNNSFTGGIPPEFSNLTNLEALHLYNNQLSGCYAPSLTSLCEGLSSYNLFESYAIGDKIVSGNQFPNHWVSFCSTSNVGSCASTCESENYQALRALYMSSGGDNWTNNSGWPNFAFFLANPTPPTPMNISDWYGVTTNSDGCVTAINLTNNNLSGTIASELYRLDKLYELNLSNNQLTGGVPIEFSDAPNLCRLIINNNQLSGCYYAPYLQKLCKNLEPAYNTNAYISNGNAFDASWEDFCNTQAGSCTLSCEERGYIALRALYLNTSGDNWDYIDENWPISTFFNDNYTIPTGLDMSTWNGITMDNTRCITEIDLLNIYFGKIEGNIPPEIQYLEELTVFRFGSEDMNSTFPVELTALNNLDTLDMHGLLGTLPSEIGNMISLNYFYISGDLNGKIPPEMGNLTELGYISMVSGNMTGYIPAELGNLSNLEYLNLLLNDFVGSIPPELGNLNQLNYLNLSHNKLKGSIPGELGNLSNLTELKLSSNNLTGCFDTNLINLCDQLTEYSINSYNDFDAFWTAFCNSDGSQCPLACQESDYVALRALYLATDGDNWYNNSGWPNAAFFNANPTLPANYGIMSWYGIYLDPSNGCVDEIRLDDNTLVGTIPPEIGTMVGLVDMDLGANALTGNIPPELGDLPNLVELHLDNNQLSGNIPPELSNLDSLTRLHLDINQLSGNIPPELGDLSNLSYLGLHGNQLSGSIPPELGKLSNLNNLHLGNNQLTGNIPPEFGGISNLYTISLGNNQLTGQIPSQFGNLNLVYLIVNDNQLSGCYDINLANLCSGNDMTDDRISEGNNFDATWSEFCDEQIGACPFSKIQSIVFQDLNQNKIQDPDEPDYLNASIMVEPGASIAFPNLGDGNIFYVQPGSYTVTFNEAGTPNWILTTDSISYFINLDENECDSITFGLYPITQTSNIQPFTTSSITRCNEVIALNISTTNLGTTTASGTLWLEVDENILATDFIDMPDATVAPNRYGWFFNDLHPSYSIEKQIALQIPGPPDFPVGDLLEFNTYVDFEDENGAQTSPTFTYTPEVRCSYDPNDKLVNPSRDGDYTLFDEELIYTVRFQNTGNDVAYDVVIRDTLDTNLDLTTFRVLGSSHADKLNTSMRENGILNFEFKDIFLPDSTSNFEGSQGYVSYLIRTIDGLAENTPVTNSAGIYFDLNPPVITNTVQSVMVSELPTVSVQSPDNELDFNIIPNPNTGSFHIQGVTNGTYRIFNTVGQVVHFGELNNDTLIDIPQVASGVYFIEIREEERVGTQRFVKQ